MGHPLQKPKEVKVTPDNLLDVIRKEFSNTDYKMGFRGQRKASWSLTPTFARFVDRLQLPTEARPEIRYASLQRSLHDTFRDNVLINKDLTPEEIDRVDLWQYGQHHGLPTPLLDWTWSPYVGLFFALVDSTEITGHETREPRSLWALNVDLLRHINTAIKELIRPKLSETLRSKEMLETQMPEMEILDRIDAHNRRLAYQQGFFTKHVYYKSFEIWAKRVSQEMSHSLFNVPLLTKLTFEVDEEKRSYILKMLDQMNINSRILFPDIKGSVDYACFRVEHCRRPARLSFSASSELPR